MDTERVLRTATHKLTQKDNVVVYLFDRDVVVLHAGQHILNLVQLVVVGCKEGLCSTEPVVVEVLDHCPRDRDTIVGACAATNLVE